MSRSSDSILRRWGISEGTLTELIDQSPSLRGMLFGYVAEYKFHEMFLSHPAISSPMKVDDHNRSLKGDRHIKYRGVPIIIEVKSLQTNSVKSLGDDKWTGKSQVDASDKRVIKFKDGSTLNTTLLRRGEFDLLAINCFAFGEKWRFSFALNQDLPCSTFKGYSEQQKKQLIASLIPVAWPPQPPFTADPMQLLNKLVRMKRAR